MNCYCLLRARTLRQCQPNHVANPPRPPPNNSKVSASGTSAGRTGVGVRAAIAVCVAAIAVCVAAPAVRVAIAVCVAAIAVRVAEFGIGVFVDPGGGAHPAKETLLVSNVTAPVCANALPDKVAPVFTVILVCARIFPLNAVVVPRVAELPTCQNTLQAEPPLTNRTDDADAVVSVLPILKTQIALGLPWASSVSAPVNPTEDE
jgi:hypothetical protein